MSDKEVEKQEVAAEPLSPKEDTLPGLLIGIQAMVGTVMWILTMFVYIKTNSSDPNLDPSTPFLWFWKNLNS